MFCAQPGYVANGRTSEKNAAVWAAFRQHNNQRDCSHLSSDGSSFQITVFGNPSEQETGGSQAANAFSFMRILISAYLWVVSRPTCPSQPRITFSSTPDSRR